MIRQHAKWLRSFLLFFCQIHKGILLELQEIPEKSRTAFPDTVDKFKIEKDDQRSVKFGDISLRLAEIK